MPWGEPKAAEPLPVGQAPLPSLRSGLLPCLIMAAVIAWPAQAADTLIVNSYPGAALASGRRPCPCALHHQSGTGQPVGPEDRRH